MFVLQQPNNLTTKRNYLDLGDYAKAHHATASDYIAFGWSPNIELRKGRRALKFQTANGPRWRYIDGEKPTYDNPFNYQPCWYGLDQALQIHQRTGQPLVDCNGAASTITGQRFGLAAYSLQAGEGATLKPPLLDQLRATGYSGQIIVPADCDWNGGGKLKAIKRVQAYRAAGFDAIAVDLQLPIDGGDLADFAALMPNPIEALTQCPQLPIPVPISEPARPAARHKPPQEQTAYSDTYQDAKDEIRRRIDCFEYMRAICGEPDRAEGNGGKWKAPNRSERTASFHVYKGERGYYDFGAAVGGSDIFALDMLLHGGSFMDSLHRLADYANVKLPEFHVSAEAEQTSATRGASTIDSTCQPEIQLIRDNHLTLGTLSLVLNTHETGAALALMALAVSGLLLEGQLVDTRRIEQALALIPWWQVGYKTLLRGMERLQGTFLELVPTFYPIKDSKNPEYLSDQLVTGSKIGKRWRLRLERGTQVSLGRAKIRIDERLNPPDPDLPLSKVKPAIFAAMGKSATEARQIATELSGILQPVYESERQPGQPRPSTVQARRAQRAYERLVQRLADDMAPILPEMPIHTEADLIVAYAYAYAKQDAAAHDDGQAQIALSLLGELFAVSKPTARKIQAALGEVEKDRETVAVKSASAIAQVAREQGGVVTGLYRISQDGTRRYVALGDPANAKQAAQSIEASGDRIEAVIQRANKIKLADAPGRAQPNKVETVEVQTEEERQSSPATAFQAYRPRLYFGDGYNPDYVLAWLGQAVYKADVQAGRAARALNSQGQLVVRATGEVLDEHVTHDQLFDLLACEDAGQCLALEDDPCLAAALALAWPVGKDRAFRLHPSSLSDRAVC